VIWDVDDVLNQLMRAWFDEWWRPRHQDCQHRFVDLSANPPHQILGIALETYLSSLDAFREERFGTLVPRPELVGWFAAHGDRAHHVALTAVPRAFAHLSGAWVMKHFGDWIRTFAFVPAPRGRSGVAGQRVTKAEYLEWLGQGDVFVDDRDENVAAARVLGLHGVVVPQPWNRSSDNSINEALQALTAVLGTGR
jgi:hypothetical protein